MKRVLAIIAVLSCLGTPGHSRTLPEGGVRLLLDGVLTGIADYEGAFTPEARREVMVFDDQFRVGAPFSVKIRLLPSRARETGVGGAGAYRVPSAVKLQIGGEIYRSAGLARRDFVLVRDDLENNRPNDLFHIASSHQSRTYNLRPGAQSGSMTLWLFDSSGALFKSTSLQDALLRMLEAENALSLFDIGQFDFTHFSRSRRAGDRFVFFDGDLTRAVVQAEVPLPAGGVLLLAALGCAAAPRALRGRTRGRQILRAGW